MKILTIRRTKPNILRIGKIRIFPGISEVHGEENIKMVQNHKTYKSLIENGVHQEITTKVKTVTTDNDGTDSGNTSDIAEMAAQKAIGIIRETYSVPVLEGMYARESGKKSRATVLTALKDQIIEIKTIPDADKDKDQ